MTRDGGMWLLVFWRCRGSGLIVVWTRWVAMLGDGGPMACGDEGGVLRA